MHQELERTKQYQHFCSPAAHLCCSDHDHQHQHRLHDHHFPPVAPLCRSLPGPSMLGISFKRPSTIICEVRLWSWLYCGGGFMIITMMMMMRWTLCATRLQVVRSIFSSLTRLETDQNDENLFLPTRSRRILLPSSSGGSSTAASTRSGKVRGTSHRQDSGTISHRLASGFPNLKTVKSQIYSGK